ncbi:MAG: hypothetical protein AAFY07_00750 [Pseudomonadota bacterium]
MREARHLALARRQLLLAQMARREAMAALADAVTHEGRSAALAVRSAQLVEEYSARPAPHMAQALREQAAFVGSLQTIHEQAGRAHNDARDQSQWQSQALAAAQSRAERMEERSQKAHRALEQAIERRDPPAMGQMARKLQNTPHEPGEPG